MLSLQQHDSITLYTRYKANSEKDDSFLLSFKGYMYAPLHQLPVAWSVHATNNEFPVTCDAHTDDFCRKIANITFNKISVNVGGVWSSMTNEAIIPVRGLYYVTFVLLYADGNLEASLFVNDLATTSIVKTTCDIVGCLMTRERAVLLSLAEKDVVTVKIIKGTIATFRFQFPTSFAGILIYPL